MSDTLQTTERELKELQELAFYIEQEAFQNHIVKPLREYEDKQKDAYDCESLRELATVKGRKQGVKEFFKILNSIHEDIKIKTEELKHLA
jgi:hypothetical protein